MQPGLPGSAAAAVPCPTPRLRDVLLERGQELVAVSRLLGHAIVTTTPDVYSHLTRGMQQGAADRMDAILTRAGSA